MRFDPTVKGLLWEAYPELQGKALLSSIDEEKFERLEERLIPQEKELDLVLRFLVYFCDRQSPLFRIRSYDDRVTAAMNKVSIARFGKTSGLASFIDKGHWWYKEVLTAYLHFTYDIQFEQWLSYKIAYHTANSVMRTTIDSTDDAKGFVDAITKAKSLLPSLTSELAQIESVLFPTPEVTQLVSEIVSSDSYGGYAERYAKSFNPSNPFD